ncbi:putative addiction module CopG family antidote [Rhizomicrobium palustre]|uniref:Putative addiction module CopG family antidote n=1 Tax=Rhizomicrobium palustre TaxID=189966 RepID=A0A846MWP7_9PROT|nr:type II toxin-antitoxin system ParD family antitoxin [Rhizomicrobium palustre]NIK87954.1 putative addiction module CopG family antidote [Rhizomicrobium palustre]
MRNTAPITITLPHEMAAMVKAKVASGEYASESEVIRDGLRAMLAREEALEKWLRTEVVQSCREYLADPSKAIPADQLMDRVRAAYRARTKKTESDYSPELSPPKSRSKS